MGRLGALHTLDWDVLNGSIGRSLIEIRTERAQGQGAKDERQSHEIEDLGNRVALAQTEKDQQP
jgi:hypothetical protein